MISLTQDERTELEKRRRSQTLALRDVRNAEVILRLAAGETYSQVVRAVGCSPTTVGLWKKRFEAEGLAGLYTRHRGQTPTKRTVRMEARILDWTQKAPPDGSTHWTTRKLAKHLGTNAMMVSRVWQRAGLQPHRLEGYMASNDPNFEDKAADVIGLYLNPPLNAVVFCVDEKTAIQALDRKDPVLPLSPGRAERHGFEYYRHGTLSLYAALNVQSGEVMGKTAERHTSQEFVAFLEQLAATQPQERELHVIVDNLSAHKTKKVEHFLAENPQVKLHFTPTYSSWLNQVELWFSKIERDIIARGVFTSIADLKKKIMNYIRQYNKEPRPFKWSYSDPKRRIQL